MSVLPFWLCLVTLLRIISAEFPGSFLDSNNEMLQFSWTVRLMFCSCYLNSNRCAELIKLPAADLKLDFCFKKLKVKNRAFIFVWKCTKPNLFTSVVKMYKLRFELGLHNIQFSALLPHFMKVQVSSSSWGSFCMVFTCANVGFSLPFLLPPAVQSALPKCSQPDSKFLQFSSGYNHSNINSA